MADNYIIETPEPKEEKLISKEFFDLLNDYYLKISTTPIETIKFQCYNSNLLDNIEYKTELSIHKLHELFSVFNYIKNIDDIFEQLIKLIEGDKIKIEKNKDKLYLNFLIKNYLGENINTIIYLDNKIEHDNEFFNLISKEIIKIRKQNKDINIIKDEQSNIKKQLEKLKKIYK